MKWRPLFCVCLAAALLALPLLPACGYSPAGIAGSAQPHWPNWMQRLSLTGLQRYDPLYPILTAELRAYGIRVVSPKTATAQLQIVEKRENVRTVGYDRRAKSRERLISLQMDFLLRARDGRVLLKRRTVTAESVYLYDADRYLESRSERSAVIQSLNQRLSQRLIRRLAAMIGASHPNKTEINAGLMPSHDRNFERSEVDIKQKTSHNYRFNTVL